MLYTRNGYSLWLFKGYFMGNCHHYYFLPPHFLICLITKSDIVRINYTSGGGLGGGGVGVVGVVNK